MKIGDRIKTLREAEGLTQNALAQKADISQSHLRRVELGQAGITVDHLQLICDALNMDICEFFEPDHKNDELSIALAKLSPKQKLKLLEFIKTL